MEGNGEAEAEDRAGREATRAMPRLLPTPWAGTLPHLGQAAATPLRLRLSGGGRRVPRAALREGVLLDGRMLLLALELLWRAALLLVLALALVLCGRHAVLA